MRKRIPKKNVAFKGKHLMSNFVKDEPTDPDYLKKLQLIEEHHYNLGDYSLEELLKRTYEEVVEALASVKGGKTEQ